MHNNPTARNTDVIDDLIPKIPSHLDTLLDIRLAMMGKAEPGSCVTSYFKLSKALSGWHEETLRSLRSVLETSIQLEIVVEEMNIRRRECLDLGDTPDINDFCQSQMKKAALTNKSASRIHLGFCWSGT